MSNYNIKNTKNQNLNTVLVMEFKKDITDKFGDVLPFPNSHYVDNKKYSYSWFIKGYFNTKNNIEYLNDIVSRFLLTFTEEEVKHKKTYRTLKPTITELKHFQGLKSLTTSKMLKRNRDNKEDFVFWCLKDYSEEVIKERGIITYETLLDFGYLHFQDYKKGFSTIKSKCRSIVKWYIENDYRIYEYEKKYNTEEELKELKMTRQQNAARMTNDKVEKNRKKIFNLLSGLFNEEYKKKNGKWNCVKINEDLPNMNIKTIRKYVKEYEEENGRI